MQNIKKTSAGFTLIELILSIALIGMIIVVFVPLFVMSAENNSKSEVTLDSTYLGRDAMELAYDLSQDEDVSYSGLETEFITELKKELKDRSGVEVEVYVNVYVDNDALNQEFTYKYDNKYFKIIFSKKGEEDKEANLVKVVAEVSKDEDMNQLEVQYESLYFWNGGI